MKRVRTLACLFLLATELVAAASVLPKFSKDKNKEFTTHDPNAVADTLRSGNPVHRHDLATELGLFTPNYSNPAMSSEAACVSFDRVDERSVRLRPDADNAVIVADSKECDSTYLIVFDRPKKSLWRHLQSVRLSARVSHPEVSFAELIQPGVAEVIVEHEVFRDTGSAHQENFMVLKLLHDRLVPVLDSAENVRIILPDRPQHDDDHIEQTQESTFRLIKAQPNSPAILRILEKQVLRQKRTSLTLYRYWNWDPELERFRSVVHDGSDVAEWTPPKSPKGSPASADKPAEVPSVPSRPAPPPAK